jgi:Lon protease-like protein
MGAYGFQTPHDLPRSIPVFPLEGALLLPRTALPLNIFEPRYLNMIDDALGAERLIGMIQPALHGAAERPDLCDIGCVGRITSYAETDDGRYLITLTGLCRFRAARELNVQTPYRQVEALFDEFGDDLSAHDEEIDRSRLSQSLRHYAEANGLHTDWAAIADAPAEALVNTLATMCPFEPDEKQALLEAPDLTARCETLITLFEIDAAAGGGGASSVQ